MARFFLIVVAALLLSVAAIASSHHAAHKMRAVHTISHAKKLPGIAIFNLDGARPKPAEFSPKHADIWKAFMSIHTKCSALRYTHSVNGNTECLMNAFNDNRVLRAHFKL